MWAGACNATFMKLQTMQTSPHYNRWFLHLLYVYVVPSKKVNTLCVKWKLGKGWMGILSLFFWSLWRHQRPTWCIPFLKTNTCMPYESTSIYYYAQSVYFKGDAIYQWVVKITHKNREFKSIVMIICVTYFQLHTGTCCANSFVSNGSWLSVDVINGSSSHKIPNCASPPANILVYHFQTGVF